MSRRRRNQLAPESAIGERERERYTERLLALHKAARKWTPRAIRASRVAWLTRRVLSW